MESAVAAVSAQIASLLPTAAETDAAGEKSKKKTANRSLSTTAEKITMLSDRLDRLESRMALTWRAAGAFVACAILYRFMSYILVTASLAFVGWQAVEHVRSHKSKTA